MVQWSVSNGLLSGNPNTPNVTASAVLYKSGCVACHADKGQDIKVLGAPKLTDRSEWTCVGNAVLLALA